MEYLRISLDLYDNTGDRLIESHNYQIYSHIYEALGQPDSAYYYHKKYIALQDSIFTPKLTHNLTNLQLAYQAEESQQVIEEKEQRLSQTTKYLWLAGMVLLICVVQLFRFYHRFL